MRTNQKASPSFLCASPARMLLHGCQTQGIDPLYWISISKDMFNRFPRFGAWCHHRHQASLLKSSIKQVVCFGAQGMALLQRFEVHSCRTLSLSVYFISNFCSPILCFCAKYVASFPRLHTHVNTKYWRRSVRSLRLGCRVQPHVFFRFFVL